MLSHQLEGQLGQLLSLACRSAIPVCTAFPAVFIEKTTPTQEELTALIVLTVGVMVMVWEGSATGSITGIILAIAATVCNAAMMSTSGKVCSALIGGALRCCAWLSSSQHSLDVCLWRGMNSSATGVYEPHALQC